jgi:hypothetical protein
MCAIGAGEHQRQARCAVLQIVQRLRIGRLGVGVVDPLHDLPGCRGGTAGDWRGALGAAVNRIDFQPIGGLADQLLERRALQDAIDQLAPILIGRLRKLRRQSQLVNPSHPAHQSLVAS